MKLVRQQHENGCVPACIAMIAGFSYSEVTKLFYSNHNWNKRGSSIPILFKTLSKLGFIGKSVSVKNLHRLRTNAILIIKRIEYGSGCHAVVWDFKKQKVWDPYPSKRRIPKRHFPLSSYQKHLIGVIEVR